MPKTLLAVDDSATMRKVLEITFSGEDFKVMAADGIAAASRLTESPAAIIVDTVLGSEDGYALARDLRQAHPGAAIVLLASRYHPYDQGRGREAGADDFADKPFDTQQLIDKVKKAMATRAATPVEAAPAPAPRAPLSANVGKSTQPSLGGEIRKNATLIFGDQIALSPGAAPAPMSGPPVTPVRAPISAAPAPAVAPPLPAAASPAAPAAPPVSVAPPTPVPARAAPEAPAAAPASPIAAQVNGQLAPKLQGLGLTPAQADAVLALSREIVERVVWEVVPQLAETLIKEEIARLTR